jgi:hypothetical protein
MSTPLWAFVVCSRVNFTYNSAAPTVHFISSDALQDILPCSLTKDLPGLQPSVLEGRSDSTQEISEINNAVKFFVLVEVESCNLYHDLVKKNSFPLLFML